ncbi:hypothetical protein ACFQUU_27210 [Herbaspirillum sp. GCM10030257]|uniref:hypothetical protein n=1 Tax=Herbaspirillum sp. GCM10030257 TaxID=3273393 RepID=UPI003606CE7E
MPTWNPTPPNMGNHVGQLYQRKLSASPLTIKAPAGHRFSIRIDEVHASLAQSAQIDYRRLETDNGIAFGTLGGDGDIGKLPTNWLVGDVYLEPAIYRLSMRSWYFGDSRLSTGTLVEAHEYTNGVFLKVNVDDAGMWQNGNGPDHDYNDLIMHVWIEKHQASAGWASGVIAS